MSKKTWFSEGTIIFDQFNVIALESILKMTNLNELKYQSLENLPFSSILRKFVSGKRFTSNEEAISVLEQYFEEILENRYRVGKNYCIQIIQSNNNIFH